MPISGRAKEDSSSASVDAAAVKPSLKKHGSSVENDTRKSQHSDSDAERKHAARPGVPKQKITSRHIASKKATSPPSKANIKRRSPRSASIKKPMNDCDDTLSELVDNSMTNNQEGDTSSSGDHSDERDGKGIPIKEILTPPRRQPVRRKKDLDTNTLDLFKAALQESNDDTLDEDEFCHFITRLYRNADQQISYKRSLSRRSVRADGSGEESENSSVFAECLANEEDYAIGNEQFKKTVSAINKKTSSNAPKSQSSDFKMDRRTLNWIKGASGILRKDKQAPLKGRVSTRSRKQALHKRTTKEERGLDIMCTAIEEVEVEYGPFPKAIRRPLPKRRCEEDVDQQPPKAFKKLRIEPRSRSNTVRIKLIRLIDLTRLEDQGGLKKRPSDASEYLPTKRRLLPRQLPKRKTHTPQAPKLDIEICTDLKELDQKWKAVAGDEFAPLAETESNFRLRADKILHPVLFGADIRHRPPSMDSLKRQPNEVPEKVAPAVYGPQRTRHSDNDYAMMCSRLMNMLLKMRVFVTAEFFYSDLDREWYNHDVITADLAKLGIKSTKLITVRQWKAVRRLLRPKPRRFSQRFIASQLNERNMYRCTVRRLQNNPHLRAPSGFPFDVFTPINVGTIVTAYCKVFRMIQRGKVLAFEKSTSIYFIEFESKQFGYEFCPDSDVSTSGIPSVLVKAPPTKNLASQSNTSIGHSMDCGTATGPLLGLQMHLDFSLDKLIKESWNTIMVPNLFQTSSNDLKDKQRQFVLSRNRLGDEVANRDAFLDLMEVIDVSRDRKRRALAMLHDVSENEIGRSHCDWLRGYLGSTDAVLRTALDIMRMLFGHIYRDHDAPSDNNQVGRKLLDKYLTIHSETDMPNRLLNEWFEEVNQKSREISAVAASSVGTLSDCEPTETGNNAMSLRKRLTDCGQAYVLAKFACYSAGKFGSTELLRSLQKVVDDMCESPFPNVDDPLHIYNGFLEARERSVKDLKEAVAMLECELRLARLGTLQQGPKRPITEE